MSKLTHADKDRMIADLNLTIERLNSQLTTAQAVPMPEAVKAEGYFPPGFLEQVAAKKAAQALAAENKRIADLAAIARNPAVAALYTNQATQMATQLSDWQLRAAVAKAQAKETGKPCSLPAQS